VKWTDFLIVGGQVEKNGFCLCNLSLSLSIESFDIASSNKTTLRPARNLSDQLHTYKTGRIVLRAAIDTNLST
jgi:hypothetical protein